MAMLPKPVLRRPRRARAASPQPGDMGDTRATALSGKRRAMLQSALALLGAPALGALADGAHGATPPAAAAGGGTRAAAPASAHPATPVAPPWQPHISDLIGANGWPSSPEDLRFWREMGLSWGRDSVGPGRISPHAPMNIGLSGPAYNTALPPILIENHRRGIKSLLLLGYTPPWNSLAGADSKGAPRDVRYWLEYVEAVVRKYSVAPYFVRHFQIWNEAAGPLHNGSAQATFWHGPDAGGQVDLQQPYRNAMTDYVERIHVPAARIIRKYGAYVVYGGWPDQGGLENYFTWLDYRSPSLQTRMIDNVDYLDVHYLGVGDIDRLYQRYKGTAKLRGIWQTEIGDAYMRDPRNLPSYYFQLAVWALDHEWDDADKYLSLIYHWDGLEAFRLTHPGPPRTYNPPGRALVVLCGALQGALARFDGNVQWSAGASGRVLRCGAALVLQISAQPGEHALNLSGLPAQSAYQLRYLDALSGAGVAEALRSNWQGNRLMVNFSAPQAGQDVDGKPLDAHLGYLVLTPA